MPDQETIKESVRSKYAAIARTRTSGCCGGDSGSTISDLSHGYIQDDLASLPEGANLGLGCGNPTAHAEINPGEIVVDLGSGAGVDCFLAAKKVGERGVVIGIDMTEEMLERARANAKAGGFANVSFRQGDIMDLPVDSGSADVVISNCVINLAPDKIRVYREIYRVLKPGGRFTISDVVSKGEIPDEVRNDMEQWAGCVAGAMDREKYLQAISDIGFENISVKSEVDYDYRKSESCALASITIVGHKPNNHSHP